MAKSQRTDTVILAGAAVSSALIYLLAFARSYNLLDLYQRPLLDLYRLSQDDPMARWQLVGAFLVLGVLYGLGWRAARQATGRAAWVIVLGGALACGLVLLFVYPFGAADIFDNIFHGRILGIYGANPFHDVVAQFKADPFFSYTAWREWPSAYGPGWEILAALLARLAGDGVVANVLAFKIMEGIFLAGSIGVVSLILCRFAPERTLSGVVLLAWNPVVLYETFGNGHNDMAMVFWILCAAWAVACRRYALGVLALVVGALFKFIPVLLLPAASVIALRDLPDMRARVRFSVVTVAGAMALVLLAYGPFWRGFDTLGIGRRTTLFTTSLPAVVQAVLGPMWGEARAGSVISSVAGGLTVLFAMWQAVRIRRDFGRLAFVQAAFNTLMFYLLLACMWFQSWYVLWPLGVAALLPPGRAALWAALFSYAALSKELIFAPLWVWLRPLPPQAWRELRLGPAVLSLAWLYAIVAWWDAKRRTRVAND